MKAVPPVSSSSSSSSSCVSKQSLTRCRPPDEDPDGLFSLHCDMNDCYSRLRRLVPTIPQDKKVSRVEILQHVIDYILDLQLALETHPALQRPRGAALCPAATPAAPGRSPLSVLNIDHHQRTSIVKKPEDSILCR